MTNELFESEISLALALRAKDIPTEAVERVRTVDYHPRTSRVSSRLGIGLGAGAAVTAGTVGAVSLLGAPSAFAGWSATPSATSGTQVSAAESACRGPVDTLPASSTSRLDPMATDARGPFTLVIYGTDSGAAGAHASCLVGPTLISAFSNSGTGGGGSTGILRVSSGGPASTGHAVSTGSFAKLLPDAGGLQHATEAGIETSQAGAYTLVSGGVAPTVTGVDVVTTDGQTVAATVSNGWFIAWWPGSATAASARVTSSQGTTSVPLDAVPAAGTAPPPPPGT